MTWAEARAQYPALGRWTYLNTATYGHVALRSQAAMARHFARREEFGCRDFLDWFGDMDGLRAMIGRLINCTADDIAFTSSAAAALSLFLGGIGWEPGDTIVTLRDEFPNQYYYASWLGSRGVKLVEMDEISALPDRTRAVVLSTVNYTSGYRPDVAGISKIAHAAGALLYVDGTQSLGALRFDVKEAQPDMFAVDPYKWLLAPNGASFFYVSPALRQTLQPSVFGWRSDKGWRSVDELHHGVPQLPDAAERYEGGMLNFPSLYGLEESLRMVFELGPEEIERRVLKLASQVGDVLRECGASIQHDGSNIVAAHWPDRDASEVAKRLLAERIIVAARHGNLRVSPHFYNDESDVAQFGKTLRHALIA